MTAASAPPPRPTLAEALGVWTRVALLSFGGPAGQIAVMHRLLVEERRWLGDGRFLHALNFCMLLPGPEAQQLATYLGWLMHGVRGGLLAGLLFILPGAAAMLALALAYATWGEVPLVAALFLGLKAAVLAVVLQAVVRIGGRALRTPAARGLAALSLLAILAFGVPFPAIVAVAALLGWLAPRAFAGGGGHGGGGPLLPDAGTVLGEETGRLSAAAERGALRAGLAALLLWLGPLAALWLLAPFSVLAGIALLFSKLAVVTFGGAYAVLAYVAQEAVQTHGWLAPGEMLDGLGLAETTPGPLILVLEFVGVLAAHRDPGGWPPLLAGTAGGLVALWATFAPCFAWIFLGAPWIERLRSNRTLASALAAVTAAVVGVVLNLALWFALHVLFREVAQWRAGPLRLELPVPGSLDPLAAALAAAALVATFGLRLGTGTVLAGAALAGLLAHLAGLA